MHQPCTSLLPSGTSLHVSMHQSCTITVTTTQTNPMYLHDAPMIPKDFQTANNHLWWL